MKRNNYDNSKDNDRDTMPRRPIMPEQPMMPQQPMRPSMPWYPPGTAYNPIGVPPWAEQPTMPVPAPGRQPVPAPGRQPVPAPGGQPIEEPVIDFPREPGPPVTVNRNYLQGYLRTIIGRYVRIDFLIGTNTLIDKAGTLVDVGIDFVTLRETETDDLDIGDLYSIKFVRVFF